MTSNEGGDATQRPKKNSGGWKRWLLWLSLAAVVVLAVIGIALSILFHRAEPMLRASLIETLQKRFHAHVELDDLHVSVVDGFQVEGSGLRIWLPQEVLAEKTAADGDANAKPAVPKPSAAGRRTNAVDAAAVATLPNEAWRTQPWIVVRKMHFHVATRILRGKPIEVSVIYVEGVRVTLPPKLDRPHISLSGNADGSETASAPADGSEPAPKKIAGMFKIPEIEVKRIECQDALLEIVRTQKVGKPPKQPLEFEFKRAVVIPDGHGGPMAFEVDMVNAKPIGDIHSTGHAGPWVPGDPGALPLDGDYSFSNADLGTIKGISGILSSTGRYTGTLREIVADGDTVTPDFRLERVDGSPGVMLKTHFHAIVDGTNGDTILQPVDAMLGHTHIVAKGNVLRAENAQGVKVGHDIALDVTIDRGRIEDIQAISADKVFVTGGMTLHTSFHLPPGEAKVWDKLQLEGQFHMTEAQFTSDAIQGRIRELSVRGQGKPKEVKTTDPNSVMSEAQGHFKLSGGALDLPDLNYIVPGALIAVHGKYGLQDGSLAFEGDAKLDASLSEIVGGWKGLLLLPADKFLHKNGAGTDVPIHISGTRQAPKFGVDFGRLGKTDKSDKTEEQKPPQQPEAIPKQ